MYVSWEKDKPRPYVKTRDRERIEIAGLTPEEATKLDEAITVGTLWVRKGRDGELQFSPAHLPVPDPVEDDLMHPFWRPFVPGNGAIQLEMFDEERLRSSCLPTIIVQHVGAGDDLKGSYARNAAKLRSYGFECMRSRREEENGRFIEMWTLFTFYAAKGPLKEAIESEKTTQGQVDAAVSFLCRHVHFGSLDACVQYAALQFD